MRLVKTIDYVSRLFRGLSIAMLYLQCFEIFSCLINRKQEIVVPENVFKLQP